MTKNALAWFQSAKNELECTDDLREGKFQIPSYILCFNCHLSVKKHLIGYLLAMGEQEMPVDSTLEQIRTMCEKHSPLFASLDIVDACKKMDNYDEDINYPYGMKADDSDVSAALHTARFIEQFAPIQKAFQRLS